jgi:hypothetical protein
MGVGSDLRLFDNQKWTVWENIEYLDKKENNAAEWESKIRRVAWFDDMINFHQAWNRIPHAKMQNVLYNTEDTEFKVFMSDSNQKYVISAI